MIDSGTIDQIIESAQVEEVVGEFVTLKKRGSNYIGLCPFHNEKTPSFSVSPSKGIYKCFGCGQAGNSVKFLMDHEHYSYPEALRYLAKKYNIEIIESEDDRKNALVDDKRESLLIINSFAQKYYEDNLFENEEGKAIGMSYFKERGFREDIIKKFHLGYALDDFKAFTNEALGKGYNFELLKELGLVSEKNGNRFDFFRGRVVFSIHNLSGKVIAFAGRTLSKEKSQPKYVNSPETPVYNKSKVLYGAFYAKNAIRQKDECYLVEGYTDVLSLHQNGIENVVASSGTALTQEQVRLVKRYTPNITILYDGDAAGIKAAMRGLDIVLEEGMNVKVVLLPENEDPDSYIRTVGATEFEKYVKEKAKDFIFFKAGALIEETRHDPVKKSELIKDIVTTIAKIPDPIKRSLYVRECSSILDVGEQLLVNEVNKITRERISKGTGAPREEVAMVEKQYEQPAPHQETTAGNADEHQERDVIRLLLEYGTKELEEGLSVTQFILSELHDHEFSNPNFEKIFRIFHQKFEEGEVPDEKYFVNNTDPVIAGTAIDIVTENYEISKNWETKHEIIIPPKGENFKQDVMSAILRIQLKRINNHIRLNQQEIKEAKDEATIMHLMALRMELNNIKNNLAAKLNTVIIK